MNRKAELTPPVHNRLAESMETLHQLQDFPHASKIIGAFMIQPIAPDFVTNKWWQGDIGYYDDGATQDLLKGIPERRLKKEYPLLGATFTPVEVDGELLTLRRLTPVHTKGLEVTELVSIENNKLQTVVDSRKVYGSAEKTNNPLLTAAGGHLIDRDIARAFAIVLNQLALVNGLAKVQLVNNRRRHR